MQKMMDSALLEPVPIPRLVSLVSLAAGKVHKTVKFSGGTAKNVKSAKRVVWSETSVHLSNCSGLRFMDFAFLASLAVQIHFPRRYEVAR